MVDCHEEKTLIEQLTKFFLFIGISVTCHTKDSNTYILILIIE